MKHILAVQPRERLDRLGAIDRRFNREFNRQGVDLMMKPFRSRAALMPASLAALSLTATPASARHWRNHDRGIEGGDVLAGVLILGGIAAVAAAASNSSAKRAREASDYRYPETRYPEARYPSDDQYRDWRAERDADSGYAQRGESGPYAGSDWRGAGAIDGAVSACTGEIERGQHRIDSVESVNREADGWRTDGRLQDGRAFSCTSGSDGRIRSATVDGRALM